MRSVVLSVLPHWHRLCSYSLWRNDFCLSYSIRTNHHPAVSWETRKLNLEGNIRGPLFKPLLWDCSPATSCKFYIPFVISRFLKKVFKCISGSNGKWGWQYSIFFRDLLVIGLVSYNQNASLLFFQDFKLLVPVTEGTWWSETLLLAVVQLNPSTPGTFLSIKS